MSEPKEMENARFSTHAATCVFVQGAAASQNWKERYAAAVAVGAVAAGLSEAALRRVLAEFLPTVLTACGARLEPGEKQAMFGCIGDSFALPSGTLPRLLRSYLTFYVTCFTILHVVVECDCRHNIYFLLPLLWILSSFLP
jgi:hypothetical protein